MTPAQLMDRWDPIIRQASKRFGVPKGWIRDVMALESGGRTMLSETQPITSSMGALGLMQLMPATYAEMQKQYGLGPDPLDPSDNILAGTAYLSWLHSKYGYPNMFAAYNDGPGNLEAQMFDLALLPDETQVYVGRITGLFRFGPGSGKGSRSGFKPVSFTRPNGTRVVIDIGAGRVSLRAATPGEFAPGVRSVITVGRRQQGVRENFATAEKRIRAHRGALRVTQVYARKN